MSENFFNHKDKKVVDQFKFDSADVERLIKLWQELHPKDEEIEPRSLFSVYINKELGEVSNHTLYKLLTLKVCKDTLYWLDRIHFKVETFLSEKPVDYLLNRYEYLKNKK